MISFERGVAGNSFLVTIQQESDLEKYACRLDICKNPVCSCTTVGFGLYRVVGSGIEPSEEDMAASFDIDIYKKVIDRQKGSLSPKDRHYAELFISQIREEDWTMLRREFYEYKTALTEKADLDAVSCTFPIEQIESRGAMIGYKEILPYGRDIYFHRGDLKIIVDDQYCVRSDCNCSDACLAFIPVGEDNVINGQVMEGVFVDYRTGRWSFREPVRKISDAERMFKTALEEQQRDVYAHLRKRHQTLKKLYQNYRKQSLALGPAERKAAAVGRNAPCPCGSGKKFKKCCGK